MIGAMDAFGAFGPAWERMRRMLFVRSSAGVWFSFGLAFFLQDCVEGGNSYNFNGDPGSVQRMFSEHGPLGKYEAGELLLFGGIALLVSIPILVLALWLGARGQAVALRSVMSGYMNLGAQWTDTREAGGRIFGWHLRFALLSSLILLPLVGAFVALGLSVNDAPDTRAAVILGALFCIGIVLLPLMAYRCLVRNFVFPLMVGKNLSSRDAWQLFRGAARGKVGGVLLFFVARFLIGMAGGMVALVSTLITCCIGALPILHQTVMAPFYVFERSHALYTLASLGPELSLLETPPDEFGGFGASMPGPYYGNQGAPPPAGGFGGPPGV
jgi:hypothetical protein